MNWLNSDLPQPNQLCEATLLNSTTGRNMLLICGLFAEILHIQIATASHFYITSINISGQCHQSTSRQWLFTPFLDWSQGLAQCTCIWTAIRMASSKHWWYFMERFLAVLFWNITTSLEHSCNLEFHSLLLGYTWEKNTINDNYLGKKNYTLALLWILPSFELKGINGLLNIVIASLVMKAMEFCVALLARKLRYQVIRWL